MKTHSDKTPHTCSTCGRGFKWKYSLTKHHLSVHARERHYVCSLCSKSFQHRRSLALHMKTHSKETLSATARAKNAKEISPTLHISSSAIKDNGTQDEGMSSMDSFEPTLHRSEVPFIVNVKVEDEM